MKTRASAFKTLQELFNTRRRDDKRKVDWAVNTGVKNDKAISDFFNKTEGAAFIPYDQLPTDIQVLFCSYRKLSLYKYFQQLKQLASGGMIDIESMPENIQKDLQV